MTRQIHMPQCDLTPIKIINPPSKNAKVLLHVCCAPCSSAVLETLKASHVDTSILYYNPNIHPQEEYEHRKEESKRYSSIIGFPFIDADYDPENWFEKTRGLEYEPERGKRCTICFDIRLEYAAKYAHEHGFGYLATTLSFSRWKDKDQVARSGEVATAPYNRLEFWDYPWRKEGRQPRSREIIADNKIYEQEYCGCAYSKRDFEQRQQDKLHAI